MRKINNSKNTTITKSTKNKKSTKNYRVIIAGLLIVALGLFYFYYLSNKQPTKDATDEVVTNDLVAELTTKDIMGNYPQSPREVVKLYAKIATAYYQTELTDDQIEQLGKQARLIFDDELRDTQTEDDFLKALKEDIADYRSANRYISDYQVQSSSNVNYTTVDGKNYASIVVLFYIREGSELNNSYTRFTMRKDSDNHWKILYWELADIDDVN